MCVQVGGWGGEWLVAGALGGVMGCVRVWEGGCVCVCVCVSGWVYVCGVVCVRIGCLVCCLVHIFIFIVM